jgi:hypothetical protein
MLQGSFQFGLADSGEVAGDRSKYDAEDRDEQCEARYNEPWTLSQEFQHAILPP